LSAALDRLDFMVSIDPYLNETTRHADVILPPPPPSYSAHFDVALSAVAVRGNARYSPPVFALPEGRPDEVDIICRLVSGLLGLGTDADPRLVDDQIITAVLGKEVGDPDSPVAGRDVAELVAMLPDGPGYERRLDMMLRLGPFGDAFGARADGLNLQRLKDNPHGIDLGPLTPRVPEVLRTPSGNVELAPEPILADIPRLLDSLDSPTDGLLLIGRRHLRSNNSWMHNLPALAGGTNRCTLQVHPDDATRLGLTDMAVVTGPAGKLVVPVEVTDAIRPGVVSLPHGWGHTAPGTRLTVAAAQPGVNVNSLLDSSLIEPLSGTAVLNGVPVEVLAG
jgi:anaerobic selenocysteine-containing dehydrogenase